jgi:hypothetical protein
LEAGLSNKSTVKPRKPEEIAKEYGINDEKDVIDVSDIEMPED